MYPQLRDDFFDFRLSLLPVAKAKPTICGDQMVRIWRFQRFHRTIIVKCEWHRNAGNRLIPSASAIAHVRALVRHHARGLAILTLLISILSMWPYPKVALRDL
jgi:hypothetical protein